MRIDNLRVKNFRGYENFEIDFDPNLTVLVGDNGAGKTTILDALAVAAGTYLAKFDNAKQVAIKPDDATVKCFAFEGLADYQRLFPVEVEARGVLDGEQFAWVRALNGQKLSTTTGGAKEFMARAAQMQEEVRRGNADLVLPVVAYFRTNRNERAQSKAALPQGKMTRTLGYKDCMETRAGGRLMSDWMLRAQLRGAGGQDAQLACIYQAIETCLRSATGAADVRVRFNPESLELDVQIGGAAAGGAALTGAEAAQVLPVSKLSDGYKNTLNIVADIAYRAALLNPNLGAQVLQQTPGVVLIDEIDLHLHPKWQALILSDLRQIFPRMQFIVTTHAPSVVSSVDKAHLRLLSRDAHQAAKPGVQTYGKDASSVLLAVMGANERPAAVKAMMDAFARKLSCEDFAGAEAALAEIAAQIGNDDPQVAAMGIELALERD